VLTTLDGGCHCTGVRVSFETDVDPRALSLRACQCSFCRRHGARVTTDPKGRLRVIVGHPDGLLTYRFGLGITDFLLCARCGVFVSGMMPIEGRLVATLNVNVLDDGTPFARDAAPVRYDDETREARVARRRSAWTPAELRMPPAGLRPQEDR
jgi:hypothetical protein